MLGGWGGLEHWGFLGHVWAPTLNLECNRAGNALKRGMLDLVQYAHVLVEVEVISACTWQWWDNCACWPASLLQPAMRPCGQ